jgi:TPR repeat protein
LRLLTKGIAVGRTASKFSFVPVFSIFSIFSILLGFSIGHSQSAIAANSARVKALGASSLQAPSSIEKPDLRPILDKWAVVIGIDKFQNNSIPKLQYPSKDARDFAKFLVEKGNFAADHVLLLTNEQATLGKIKEVIGDSWLPQRARKDDLVLVFASTHGSPKEIDVAGENFLVVYDTDPLKLFSTGIKFADLAPTIKDRTSCDRVVLLLDACSSGAANVGGKGMVRTGNFDVAALAGEGQIVISSSAADQRSFESKRYENGVFTKQLIASLQSNGSRTTLTEAFRNLKEQVENEVQFDRKQTQTPVMRSRWKGGELILISVPARPRRVLPDLPGSSVVVEPPSTSSDDFEQGKKLYDAGKFAEALPLLTDAAVAGNADAQLHIGYIYDCGKGVPQSYTKAAEWYQKAADQGNGRAQLSLGYMYREGQGVPKNDTKSAEWYQKAADQGNVVAQLYLGYMYGHGQGVPKNDTKAAEWYQKAADQGNATAQLNLGNLYDAGEGVPKNDTKAVEWYQKAADQGLAMAEYAIGMKYISGEGVPKNDTKAVEWYQKAADQGLAIAQALLGYMYDNGKGVPQNYTKAVEWFQKAADQGDAGAQLNLGAMYEYGQGVPRSKLKALEWYRKSASQGNATALADVKRLEH